MSPRINVKHCGRRCKTCSINLFMCSREYPLHLKESVYSVCSYAQRPSMHYFKRDILHGATIMTITQPPHLLGNQIFFFSPHLTLSNKYLYDFQYWPVLDQASKLAASCRSVFNNVKRGKLDSHLHHLGLCKNNNSEATKAKCFQLFEPAVRPKQSV